MKNCRTENLILSGINSVHGRTGIIQDLALGVQNKINRFVNGLIFEMVVDVLHGPVLRRPNFFLPGLYSADFLLLFPLLGLLLDPMKGRGYFK